MRPSTTGLPEPQSTPGSSALELVRCLPASPFEDLEPPSTVSEPLPLDQRVARRRAREERRPTRPSFGAATRIGHPSPTRSNTRRPRRVDPVAAVPRGRSREPARSRADGGSMPRARSCRTLAAAQSRRSDSPTSTFTPSPQIRVVAARITTVLRRRSRRCDDHGPGRHRRRHVGARRRSGARGVQQEVAHGARTARNDVDDPVVLVDDLDELVRSDPWPAAQPRTRGSSNA